MCMAVSDSSPLILLAEDDPKIREILRKILDDLGLKTLEAEDGEACMELWERHAPTVVITDNSMPKLSGTSAAMRIRSREAHLHRPRTLILLQSGDDFSDERLADIGIDGYLQKPYTRSRFLTFLQGHGLTFALAQ